MFDCMERGKFPNPVLQNPILQNPILIVEDDQKTAALVALYLEREGFRTVHAADGQQALDFAEKHDPMFVVLDLMLPKVDGWEICQRIRQRSDVPILILTAREEEMDRVVCVDISQTAQPAVADATLMDSNNTVHVFFNAISGLGTSQLFHTYRSPGQAWAAPVLICSPIGRPKPSRSSLCAPRGRPSKASLLSRAVSAPPRACRSWPRPVSMPSPSVRRSSMDPFRRVRDRCARN